MASPEPPLNGRWGAYQARCGTDRLRPDRPFVVHPIGADTPPRPGDARSTLPYVLREAYRERVFGG